MEKPTTKSHQKHAKLAKPTYGWYGREEWAVVGTPCGNIQALAQQLTGALQADFKVGYLDADHGTPAADAKPAASLAYTNKIEWHQWEGLTVPGKADYWQFFNEADVVLVNGNHFQAARQVVVVDPKKYDSLKKRLDQLTDVVYWVYAEGVEEPFDFLQEAFPHWREIPGTWLENPEPLERMIRNRLGQVRKGLSAIVLAGGKSQRMGNDKTTIAYHGQPQRDYLMELLGPLVDNVYLSCRPEQVTELADDYPVLPDSFMGAGPYGAILSALQKDPDSAWLVVAVDMPYVSEESLQYLIKNRDPKAIGTAYRNPDNDLPEPLLSIWEPKAYKYLLTLLAHGITCPRKALLTTENKTLLDPVDARVVRNVNTPEDLALVRDEMG